MLIAFCLSLIFPLSILPASAATVVDYTVYGFHGSSYGVLQPGAVYSTSITATTAGVIIQIPANSQSGYFIAAGFVPCQVVNNSFSRVLSANYFVSSTISIPIANDGSNSTGTPSVEWTGVVYIPAHTNTLYLHIFGDYGDATANIGGYRYGTAFMNFIPESTSGLSEVLNAMANNLYLIRSQLQSSTAQNNASKAFVSQIDELMSQIDQLNQTIEDNTFRPPADSILPSPPSDLLPPSDAAASLAFSSISSILSHQVILSVLIMVFTLAFSRYVLFGKSS